MSWEKSDVMTEFLKIAEDQGMIKSMPKPEDRQEDDKVIVEKKPKDPEKSIMEIAHPEPAFVAESRGEGGLVENDIERHKKMMEVINKHPTGSLVGRYAEKAIELLKLADQCDSHKLYAASDKLTDAARIVMAGPTQLNLFDKPQGLSRGKTENGMLYVSGPKGTVSYMDQSSPDHSSAIQTLHHSSPPYVGRKRVHFGERDPYDKCQFDGPCYPEALTSRVYESEEEAFSELEDLYKNRLVGQSGEAKPQPGSDLEPTTLGDDEFTLIEEGNDTMPHEASKKAIELLKLANKCDSMGDTKTASLLTKSAEKLLDIADVERFFE